MSPATQCDIEAEWPNENEAQRNCEREEELAKEYWGKLSAMFD